MCTRALAIFLRHFLEAGLDLLAREWGDSGRAWVPWGAGTALVLFAWDLALARTWRPRRVPERWPLFCKGVTHLGGLGRPCTRLGSMSPTLCAAPRSIPRVLPPGGPAEGASAGSLLGPAEGGDLCEPPGK